MIAPHASCKKLEPKNNNKKIQVAEHIHSKDHVQMKGVSVGLFSPDRKERYCKSLEVGDGIMLSESSSSSSHRHHNRRSAAADRKNTDLKREEKKERTNSFQQKNQGRS